MKLFVLCRHGSYQNGHMDSLGERQAKRLRPRIKGLKVRVISSTAPRASQYTDVLVRELGLTDRYDDALLWSDSDHPSDNEGATQLLVYQSQEVDVLIVVTHLEYAYTLPRLYVREMCDASIWSTELDEGDACLFNCEALTISYIS